MRCFPTRIRKREDRRSALGQSVGTSGRAQAGHRPAIILQSVTSLPTTLIVPLTSQLDALRFAGTVLVEADSNNGLRRASVALVFQLTAVDNRYITDRLGIVSKEVLEEIWTVLDKLTGRA